MIGQRRKLNIFIKEKKYSFLSGPETNVKHRRDIFQKKKKEQTRKLFCIFCKYFGTLSVSQQFNHINRLQRKYCENDEVPKYKIFCRDADFEKHSRHGNQKPRTKKDSD